MFGRRVQTGFPVTVPGVRGQVSAAGGQCVSQTEYGGFAKVRCQVLWGPGRKCGVQAAAGAFVATGLGGPERCS